MRLWNKLLILALAVQDPSATGRKALDLLLAGKFPELSQMLSPAAKEMLTPDTFRTRVGPEVQSFGKAEEIEKPVMTKSGADSLATFPVRFSNVKINVQFKIAPSGEVTGLYFRPVESTAPYSKPELFHEREVTIGGDQWKLPGTLTVPNGKGPFPAIVLVHGPGPNDRDETMFSNKMFRDLAEGLASRGIAVLRYDKRTKVYGPQMSATNYTLQQETVDDAVRATAVARAQPEVKRVFALGHSLGGYAMPRIAARDGKLSGAIIMAGNARPIEDVVLEQNEYLLQLTGGGPDAVKRLETLKAEIAKVKALAPGQANPPVVLGLPSAYFLDLKSYDPVASAKRLGLPLLILQGQRDIQVTMKDYDRWKAGVPATFHTYPKLNHLFMAGEGPGSPAEYRRPANVAPEVIDDIAKWIAAQGG